MHTLAKHYQIVTDPVPKSENIVVGTNYRFTLLNEHVIRMEYSKEGRFVDKPSQAILNRNFDKVDFTVTKDGKNIHITTSIFQLTYEENASFTPATLKVRNLSNNSYYFYGDKIEGNYKGTARTLDNINGQIELEQGLFSVNGFSVIDDSDTLLIREDGFVEKRDHLSDDLYFFSYGNQFIEGLQFFTKMSGQTPLIPRYILGNWWSRYWSYTDEELKEVVNKFEELGMPLSVCIIDMDWHLVDIDKKYGSGWTGYSWNKDLFPDSKATIQYLKSKNLKTALNLHPADGVRAHEDQYEDFAKYMGVDYKNEEPIEFDSTSPKFIEGYFKYLLHPEEEKGVDFWWIDWQQGNTSKIEGLDPLWVLNHFHFLDLGRDGKRPFIFSRWSQLGSHRYPIGFSGDTVVSWDSLKFQPYFTSTAANVGFGYWSHDIGGHFQGRDEKELYIRWIQFGVFSPIMRLHSSKSIFSKREPWKWGEDTIKVVKRYMQLRHDLIPYIYSMSYRNYNDSIPMIVPMYYYHSDCKKAYEYSDQYYFGTELMVASITEKSLDCLDASCKEIYLPEGEWYDYFSGIKYSGNRNHYLTYTIDQYPVFAKAGAIIPLAVSDTLNNTDQTNVLEVHIFPGNNNKFLLYEDGNNDKGYLDDACSFTEFELTYEHDSIRLVSQISENDSYIPSNRSYKIVFRNFKDIQLDDYKTEYDDEQQSLIVYVDDLNFDLRIEGENNIERKDSYQSIIYRLLLEAEIDAESKHMIWEIVNGDSDIYQKNMALINKRLELKSNVVDSIINILNSSVGDE